MVLVACEKSDFRRLKTSFSSKGETSDQIHDKSWRLISCHLYMVVSKMKLIFTPIFWGDDPI